MFSFLVAIGTALWCLGEIFNPTGWKKGRRKKF